MSGNHKKNKRRIGSTRMLPSTIISCAKKLIAETTTISCFSVRNIFIAFLFQSKITSRGRRNNIEIYKRKYLNLSSLESYILLVMILLLQLFVHKTNALINAELTTGTMTTHNKNNNINKNLIMCKENMTKSCFNATTITCSNNSFLLDSKATTTTTIIKTTINLNGALLDGSDNNNNNIIEHVEFDTENLTDENVSEYIFDRTDVRIIFITLYSIVFCCCFFGNLLVILVVTMSRRLRSITNFFLANLALADFCVGLFCVMQNLSIYLIDSWVFGEFLCRMYQFVHSLSYTASIFILVVICMERYFAIVHPITCKQILTPTRLRMVILTVWITSAVYSTPKFVFSKTIKNVHVQDGLEEEICVLDRKMFNSKMLDIINFLLLYIIPLLVMTVLYSKIAIALWRSSHGLTHHLATQQQKHQHKNSMNLHNSMYHNQHQQQYKFGHSHSFHNNNNRNIQQQQLQQQQKQQDAVQHELEIAEKSTPAKATATTTIGTTTNCNVNPGMLGTSGGGLLSSKQSSKYEKRNVSISESQVSVDSNRPTASSYRRKTCYHSHQHYHHHCPRISKEVALSSNGTQRIGGSVAHMSHSSSNNVLRARRGVVRMLIIFVLTFALCNLPYHARKMWQYWSRSYRGDSNFIALLTPLTFLVSYFNSGINPLLYAFLSRNFRKGMKELLLCYWKRAKGKSSINANVHQKRMALQTYSLPTDTTHIGNEQL